MYRCCRLAALFPGVLIAGSAPTETIAGKVVQDDSGAPLASVEVRLSRAGLAGLDEYELNVHGIPHNLYLKDIAYGGTSILHEPLRVGSALGSATLRVIVARNGGYVSAKVADKDGNPVPDSYVLLMRSSATSESVLAAELISGQTDQNGVYSSDMMAPGKYLVLASSAAVDSTPESIGKLLRSRAHAQEIEIAANRTARSRTWTSRITVVVVAKTAAISANWAWPHNRRGP